MKVMHKWPLYLLATLLNGMAFSDAVILRQVTFSTVVCGAIGGTITGALLAAFLAEHAHRQESAEMLARLIEGDPQGRAWRESGKP
jgi:membrane associated rhomboid family serine protease